LYTSSHASLERILEREHNPCARASNSSGRIHSDVLAPAFRFTGVYPLSLRRHFSSPSPSTHNKLFSTSLTLLHPDPTANMSQSHTAIAVDRATHRQRTPRPPKPHHGAYLQNMTEDIAKKYIRYRTSSTLSSWLRVTQRMNGTDTRWFPSNTKEQQLGVIQSSDALCMPWIYLPPSLHCGAAVRSKVHSKAGSRSLTNNSCNSAFNGNTIGQHGFGGADCSVQTKVGSKQQWKVYASSNHVLHHGSRIRIPTVWISQQSMCSCLGDDRSRNAAKEVTEEFQANLIMCLDLVNIFDPNRETKFLLPILQ